MCDAYTPSGEPIPTNKRFAAEKIFSNPDVASEEPWYASFDLRACFKLKMLKFLHMKCDFEFWIKTGMVLSRIIPCCKRDSKWPVGWPIGGYPGPQVNFY